MTSSGVMAMRRGRASGSGRTVFVNLHGLGIDAPDLVGAELHEKGHAMAVDHHAVGIGLRRGRCGDLDLAGLRVQPPNHVGALHGEIDVAVGRQERRVGIARLGIGHGIFRDVAGLGIELADIGLEVGGEPDIAVVIGDQPVRAGALGLG